MEDIDYVCYHFYVFGLEKFKTVLNFAVVFLSCTQRRFSQCQMYCETNANIIPSCEVQVPVTLLPIPSANTYQSS